MQITVALVVFMRGWVQNLLGLDESVIVTALSNYIRREVSYESG